MLHFWSEPSLSDPVVQAVMAADAVDPTALDALLREVAHRVEPQVRPGRPAPERCKRGPSAEAQFYRPDV